jgi:hypothetical protein
MLQINFNLFFHYVLFKDYGLFTLAKFVGKTVGNSDMCQTPCVAKY